MDKIEDKDKYQSYLEILNITKKFFNMAEKEEEEEKEKEEKKKEKKNPKILELNNNFTIQNKEKLNTYFDKTFNYLIDEEREKFIIFSKQISDSSKQILRDYIIDSFSKKAYSNYSNLSKKYKYIEKTIDFSRILHQYITIEKIKNPNNFLDINSTLFNFNDYSSVLNSKNHGNFILAILCKFFEINGMKAYILKKKDTNFDKIE